MARDTERPTNKMCGVCANRCKQGPDCTIVWCRDFKKKVEEPRQKH